MVHKLCNLSSRSLVLSYQGARASERALPGGYSAGTFLGGMFFIVKFNGACLRPPVPRPISGNRTLQLKYIDDSSKVASINLKKSLEADPERRQRPFNYHERHQLILKNYENILQEELDRFHSWTITNKLKVNTSKCFVMLFSRSQNFDFPPEYKIRESSYLEEMKMITILGVQVQSNLWWDKTIWVLRRMKVLGVDNS